MASNRNRQKRKGDRQDITLMTILANEATDGSRKLLKKYGKPDAKSHADLEQKLAELYFNTADKVQLEKEMAAIHPHRKWLEKYIEPKVQEIEKVSNADGSDCCDDCRNKKSQTSCPCAMNRNWEQKSNAEGVTETKQTAFSPEMLITPMFAFGLVALVLIMATRNVSKMN